MRRTATSDKSNQRVVPTLHEGTSTRTVRCPLDNRVVLDSVSDLGVTQDLSGLETGPLHLFGEWDNSPAPRGPTGVYTVWRGDEFVYVGISYRDATETTNKAARGLWGRLSSHASGRRSGDQFCIYICDRFVLRTLSAADIDNVAEGSLSLDALTREYIRTHLAYRFLVTPTGGEARNLERVIQRGGLPSGRRPLLNPLMDAKPRAKDDVVTMAAKLLDNG